MNVSSFLWSLSIQAIRVWKITAFLYNSPGGMATQIKGVNEDDFQGISQRNKWLIFHIQPQTDKKKYIQ